MPFWSYASLYTLPPQQTFGCSKLLMNYAQPSYLRQEAPLGKASKSKPFWTMLLGQTGPELPDVLWIWRCFWLVYLLASGSWGSPGTSATAQGTARSRNKKQAGKQETSLEPCCARKPHSSWAEQCGAKRLSFAGFVVQRGWTYLNSSRRKKMGKVIWGSGAQGVRGVRVQNGEASAASQGVARSLNTMWFWGFLPPNKEQRWEGNTVGG